MIFVQAFTFIIRSSFLVFGIYYFFKDREKFFKNLKAGFRKNISGLLVAGFLLFAFTLAELLKHI